MNISIDATNLQNDSNKAQCKSIIEEGKHNARSQWVQMGASFATAGADAFQLGKNSSDTKDLYNDLTNVSNQNTELTNLETSLKTTPLPAGAASGPAGAVGAENPDFTARKEAMKNRNPLDATPEERARDQDAINISNEDDRAGMQNQIVDQRKANTKQMQSIHSQIQSKEGLNRIGFDIGKQGLINAPSQAVQASNTNKAAQAKAAQLNAQFCQSTEQTVEQTELKAIDSNLSYMNSIYQALVQAGNQPV